MKILILNLVIILSLVKICFGQWVQLGLEGESIKDIAARDSNIFVISLDSCDLTSGGIYCTGKGYRSTDGGTNWTMIVDSMAVDFAISSSGKVFMVHDDSLNYSLDNGDTWIWSDIVEQIGQYGYWDPITITVSPSGIVFCGLRYYEGSYTHGGDKLAVSTDDGLNWTCPIEVLGGLGYGIREQYVITIGYSRYSGPLGGLFGYDINLSSDYGINWSLLESDGWETPRGVGCPQFLHAIGHFTNNNIILNKYCLVDTVTVNELYISSDMCSTWTKIAEINTQSGISLSNGYTEGMLIGTDSLGVFLFSDEGDSLGSRNDGLTNLNIQTLTLDNNGYIYAGTENGIWRRTITEIVTSIDVEPTQPTEFILSQNYPNPFNPSTVISYQLPVGGNAEIKVYDVLGNEIVTLVDEYKPAGKYEVEFNAEKLASGIYFYQLKAGEYTAVKKMLLIK
jgi:hypothetical protein